jgi:hypothetical protein
MSSPRAAAVLSTVALMSCISDHYDDGGRGDPLESPDGDGNDNGDNPAGGDLAPAKALFDTGVYPTLVMKCSTNACHSETATGPTLTRFVATDAARGWQVATNYAALIGNHAASNAPVLTLVTPGAHKGITYTTDEAAKLTAWLASEIEIRNGQAPPLALAESLSQATERARREFVACMTLTDFQTANMAQAWAGLYAQNNERCDKCHASGGDGFIATEEGDQLYTALTTTPAMLMQYFTVDLTTGASAAKMIVNQSSHAGVSLGGDPHREHPRFNSWNNQGVTAVTQFYNATMARKAAGTCDPPSAHNLVD